MIKLLTTTIAAALFISTAAFADDITPPMNLDTLKAEIVKYHEDGAYLYDIQKIENNAQQYLAQRVKQNQKLAPQKKLAMVFDIDETALSNYQDMVAEGFGGASADFVVGQAKAHDPVIEPSLHLYQYAINHGVTVFFISGRSENQRSYTVKNLVNAGYTTAANSTQNCENKTFSNTCVLFLRDGKFLHTSAIPFKSSMRSKIADAGYDIVINVGDQYSDLAGGYSEQTFKYPNFMYYIP